MQLLPDSLDKMIDALRALPGVGPKSAERYAYFLLRSNPQLAQALQKASGELHAGVSYCQKTFALINSSDTISPLYDDSSRNKQLVAVVADPFDVIAIEKTGNFKGTYHVLGGLLSPIDGIGPEELHIPQLLKRVKDDSVEEIILATNASVEGESTALYLQKQLEEAPVKISRLARGLPVGTDIDYADQITLGRALDGRTALS